MVPAKVEFDKDGLPVPPKVKISFDADGLPVPPQKKNQVVSTGGGKAGPSGAPLPSGGQLPTGLTPSKVKITEYKEPTPAINVGEDPVKAASVKVTDLSKLIQRQAKPTISTTAVKAAPIVQEEKSKERRVERAQSAKAKVELDKTVKAFKDDANLSTSFLMQSGKLKDPNEIDLLSNEQILQLADPSNETQKVAVNTLVDAKNARTAVKGARNLEEAAILYAGTTDPQVQRQIDISSQTVPTTLQETLTGTGKKAFDPNEMFAEATRGRMLYQFLSNPVAFQEISKNPALKQEVQNTLPLLIQKYPDFGKMYLGQKISQKMEDMGINNAILNIVTEKETDDAVNELVKEGKMTENEKNFYNQYLRGEGGFTDFGRKILGRQVYDTPGLVESTLGGAGTGVLSLGKGVSEITGLRKALVGEQKMVGRDIAERDLAVNVAPKGIINEITKYGGQFLGQSLSIGGGGKVLSAIKAIKNVPTAAAVVGGLQAYANYIPDARQRFPGDELKQRGYATVLATLEAATENIFRDQKIVDGLLGKMKPEVGKVIQDFTAKKISAEAAKQTLTGQIKNALSKIPEAAKYYGKGVVENTAEEVAAQLGQQITSGVFENKPVDEWINGQELFDVARQSLLGSAFVAGLSARADMMKNRGISAKMIYGMAENPDYWSAKIQEAAALDPDIAAEAQDKLDNLAYVSKVYQDVQGQNMSEKQKIKYVINALDAKVKKAQADAITDPVLKKKAQAEASALEADQEALLDGTDDGSIEGDVSDRIVGEEVAPQVPAASEIEAKKADIERRRQEELNKRVPKQELLYRDDEGREYVITYTNDGKLKLSIPVENGTQNIGEYDANVPIENIIAGAELVGEYKRKNKQSFISKINAKYDAELAALGVGEEVVPQVPAAPAKAEVVSIDEKETIRQMKPFTDEMANIEREFENRGYKIDTDYDNEIIVTDRQGNILDPEEIPSDIADLAAAYEQATMKLGEFDQVAREKALAESRKVEEVVGEEVAPQVPAAPEITKVKSPKEVKQGDTVIWRGEEFKVDDVNQKGGFNLTNKKDPTWTVKDARITDEEFEGKREEVAAAPKVDKPVVPGKITSDALASELLDILGTPKIVVGEVSLAEVFTKDNLDEISEKGLNDVQKKVVNDVKNVVKSVSNLVEKTTGNELKVTIHKDQNTYGDAVINAGGTKQDSSTKGFYLDADGTIHLNMARVTSETMLHEGFHPVLDFIAKNNPEVINGFFVQIGKLDGGRAILNEAIEAYRGSDEITIKKEAITDFVAKVADGSFEINQTNFEKVKSFILDLIKKLGFGLRTDIKDIDDVRELAKFISDKFSSGKEIMSKEFIPVKNDGQPGEVAGAGRLDGSEIVNAKVPGKNPLKFSKEKFKEVGLISLPEVSLEEKAKEFNNKAIAINSDPTRVGELTLPSGKKVFMYGGLNYTALEPNVKGEIGFASTTLSKPKQVSGFIKSLFPETDGVGLVLTTSQKPESMLGNAYSLEYVLDAISQLPAKTLRSSEFKREFFGKDIVAVREAFGAKEYNEFVKKYGKADLGSPDVIQQMVEELLTDIGNNFIARNNLVSNMLAGVVEKSTRAATKGEKGFVSVTPNKFIAKVLFDNFGLNQEKLFNEIGEKGIVDAYMNEGKWGFITGGFESDSKIDYLSIQDKGVIHPQFNAKFHGRNAFLLDGAYMIDKLFKPELLEKNKKGELYIDSKTGLPKPYEKKASLMVAGSMYPKGVIEVAAREFAKPIPQFSRPIELDVVEGFYSPIQKRILEFKQPKASATKWKEIVGVKSDEAVFSGLADWLNSQKPDAQLSKQDVLNFMKDNRIEIKEVQIGDPSEADIEAFMNDEAGEGYTREEAIEYLRGDEGATKYSQYQLPGGENYKEVLITLPFKNKLFTERDELAKKQREAFNSGNYELANEIDNEISGITKKLKEQNSFGTEKEFKSSHFDEPNIITHLRMNTRTDADGKKVLFLEELQSDWGQKGKREGFKIDKKEIQPQLDKVDKELRDKYGVHTITGGGNYYGFEVYKDGKWVRVDESDTINVPESKARELISSYKELMGQLPPYSNASVSKAPFVTNTNAWVKLGLKYALKEAVRQGADRIAWTTGEQQNERYDLSKQVGSIIYNKNANGTYDVSATRPEIVDISVDDAGANFLFNEYDIAPKRIEDVFGKDVADKIINNEGDVDDISGYTTLKGDNLKVGGKGMKAFYDKIVPDVAKSLVKELTGKQVEVGEAKIDVNERGKSTKDFDDLTSSLKFEKKLSDEGKKGIVSTINKDGSYTVEWYEKKPTTQQSIDITPELRQSVQGGMPQFSRDNQLLKIKDFVQVQRNKGVSDDVIREALDKVAGKIGLTKQEIDNLMAGEFPTKPKEYAVQEQAAGEVPVQPEAGVSEEVEGGVPPTEPKKVTKESKAESEKELDRLANNVPDTGKVAEYLSKGTIIKYTGEAPANEQARGIQELGIALEHGKKIIEKAKEVFGEDYVEKTLDYIENSTASVSNKALMYVSLENELVKEKLANPNRAGEITKQQALVYAQSQALARENSLSLNYQKLRQYAIKGYDRSIVTDQIYTSQELESKKDISSAIEASPEQVNQAAEEAEAEVEGAKLFTEQELEKKVEQGVRAEVDRLFNQLPKKDKTRAEKALDVLAKFKQKLRGRTYDATLGIPVAIIDAGITTIENAIKLGISIEKAIDLGIKKIKEGLRGKSWDKENDFREDMINAYKEAGIDTKAKTSPTTKKQIVKDALIKSGFGRTVTIKGQEREILDWKKLAGRAGTVENIQRNVENVLREEGYTQEEIDNSKEEFTKEYIDLRQSIIEKAQNELARRNKSTVSPKQKSAAKRLAELYTFGLFEQNRDEFDNLINSALGVQFDEKTFKEANKIAEAMENVYNQSFNGVRLNDLTGKSALENLNDKIRLLTVELSKKQGPWYFRAVNLLKGYMNFSQTMILNTLKNSTENLSSGAQQKLIDKLFLTIGKETTPELVKERRRLMKDIYKDMIVNGGIGYGKVENEFVNRRHIDDYVNKLSDKKLVQGIASVLTGKATLNAMDAMFKAGLTEARFTSNLVKILISPSNKNRMTKEEAVKFVSEQLTGQTIEDARVTAKDVIDKINKDAGQELIKPTKEQINRLANDIVKAALEMNGTITTEQMMAAYNAAYRSAGLSIGHESNNALTSQLRAWAANIESNINRSIKEKEWANATLWLLNSIFINNIVSPFVGGGTNWLVLKLEKTGLGLFTGLAYEASGKKELDLTTRTGLDQLERRLFTQSRAKDSYMRGAIGGLTSLLLYAGFMGIADEEEYRKWRGKNRWAVKYLDLITPEYLLASIAAKDKRLPQYVESSLLGKNEAFSITTKIVKSVNYAVKGDSPKTWGAVGETIGARLNAPLPWRLVRDGQILYDGIRGEDPYHGNYKPSVGFWSGVLQGGAIEWMGLRPMGKGKVQVAQFKVIDYQTEEERDATNEEIRQVENLSNILYKQYLPAYKSNTEDIWVAVGDKVKISKEGYSKKEVELWEEKSYNQLTKEQQDQLDELVQKKALKDAKIELDLKEKKE